MVITHTNSFEPPEIRDVAALFPPYQSGFAAAVVAATAEELKPKNKCVRVVTHTVVSCKWPDAMPSVTWCNRVLPKVSLVSAMSLKRHTACAPVICFLPDCVKVIFS